MISVSPSHTDANNANNANSASIKLKPESSFTVSSLFGVTSEIV
jgi:hypothetical protein